MGSYLVSSIPVENELFSNRSILPINGTLTDTTTPGQSGSRGNGNEGVQQVSRTGASLTDTV